MFIHITTLLKVLVSFHTFFILPVDCTDVSSGTGMDYKPKIKTTPIVAIE